MLFFSDFGGVSVGSVVFVFFSPSIILSYFLFFFFFFLKVKKILIKKAVGFNTRVAHFVSA